MNAIETISELIELGFGEVLFTMASSDSGPPKPAIQGKQLIHDADPKCPPRIVTHQLVRATFQICLEEALADARAQVKLRPKKKSPAPNNVVSMS